MAAVAVAMPDEYGPNRNETLSSEISFSVSRALVGALLSREYCDV